MGLKEFISLLIQGEKFCYA